MNNEMAGRLIKELRIEKDIPMSEFAKRLKLSHPSLSRIENGNQELSFTLLIKICDELGISTSEFFSKLEETNHLYILSSKEIEKDSIEDSKELERNLHTMISDLSDDQRKALYVLLHPFLKK
jgi:HTH-type transcriptional regulator / antitoxin PezA